ncbi:TetR/AcrR family transcriptional regulator [Glycomyces harbinensis]|uniref:Transcriptional regulator, TetR family n=1 Tax=Glycomyces harbinensis TaxID=58114 RepID=A0A1G6QZS2_9ACTN|nr:TetR/AcrR family transcriptional regulator [Glycomyces harbinensis]SDC97879.1 transcriptional regulator, TetR family [Glycomyces harbinensis]
MKSDRVLSTADERRAKVVSSAVATFAQGGFHAVTIADVAKHAGISPAYVLKLFTSKTQLFTAALEECYRRIMAEFKRAGDSAEDASPTGVLDAMGEAYADLIGDRDLLMLQVHAQSAATVEPLIGEAVRGGIAALTDYLASRTRVEGWRIQQFLAVGQLCHLLTTIDAFDVDAPWAKLLTEGIRHADARPSGSPAD